MHAAPAAAAPVVSTPAPEPTTTSTTSTSSTHRIPSIKFIGKRSLVKEEQTKAAAGNAAKPFPTAKVVQVSGIRRGSFSGWLGCECTLGASLQSPGPALPSILFSVSHHTIYTLTMALNYIYTHTYTPAGG